MEDNKQLAAKIDGSINAANQEVSALRAELEDTNKRLSQMSDTELLKKDCGSLEELESDIEGGFYEQFIVAGAWETVMEKMQ